MTSKLKRNDSLTKREKQDANKQIMKDSNLPAIRNNLPAIIVPGGGERAAATTKQMKTLANQGLYSVLS